MESRILLFGGCLCARNQWTSREHGKNISGGKSAHHKKLKNRHFIFRELPMSAHFTLHFVLRHSWSAARWIECGKILIKYRQERCCATPAISNKSFSLHSPFSPLLIDEFAASIKESARVCCWSERNQVAKQKRRKITTEAAEKALLMRKLFNLLLWLAPLSTVTHT